MKRLFKNKIFLIVAPLLGAVLFAMLVSMLTGRTVIAPKATPTPTPFTSAPTSEKIEVNKQEVKNFYKDSTYTYPEGDIVIEENQIYQIAFLHNEQKFVITATFPVPDAQQQAENAFLQKLNISKNDACKLNVQVLVYTTLDSKAPPKESGLSFCK